MVASWRFCCRQCHQATLGERSTFLSFGETGATHVIAARTYSLPSPPTASHRRREALFPLLAICRISGRVHSAAHPTPLLCSAHGEPPLVDLRHSRAPGCRAGSLLDNALAIVRIFLRGVDMFYKLFIDSSIPTYFPIDRTSYLDALDRINLKRFRPSSKLVCP